jgi:hypothetical protein
MTPEYILRKSLCRPAHCADNATLEDRTRQIEYMTWAHEYAEPGYSQPEKGILFANWNYFPRGLDSILEHYGYEMEWEDEWSTCGDCGRAIRTSADSYCWQPSYVILNECELICIACLNGHADEYLESLENNPRKALNVSHGINPADYGYTQVGKDFENGFHPHQNDNPKKIYDELRKQGHPRILFTVDSVGQFDLTFSAWIKSGEVQS